MHADEDVLTGGQRHDPQFKPDGSPDLLTQCDYFGRPVFLRAAAVRSAGSLDSARDAAACWDLHLRVMGADMSHVSTLRLARMTQVLCHRAPPGPHGMRRAATRRHRARRLAGRGPAARVGSVVIPNEDRAALLGVTLRGLLDGTDYPRIETIDNGSAEADTLAPYARARGVQIVPFDAPFNYAHDCNIGTAAARGDPILFLNNDVEMRDPGWLSAMVRRALLPSVGMVGTVLDHPDGRLQQADVIVGMHVCGLAFHGADHDDWGPFGAPMVTRNRMAVMGTCQMVRRAAFDQAGGADDGYRIAMSDVKLCLDTRAAGWRAVCVSEASLVHHEGMSRGRTNPLEDVGRITADIRNLHLCPECVDAGSHPAPPRRGRPSGNYRPGTAPGCRRLRRRIARACYAMRRTPSAPGPVSVVPTKALRSRRLRRRVAFDGPSATCHDAT